MSDEASMDLAGWLDHLGGRLPEVPGTTLTPGERKALLDLARVAAHTSERIAAPLTTFIAGVAFGHLPVGEREAALRQLADDLGA